MTLTNNGDLIPEIVRRGFQELLEAEVFALTFILVLRLVLL